MIFLGAFRYMVGIDYQTYDANFKLAGLGYNTPMEYGFDKLAQLVHYIGGTPQLVFAVSSLLTILLIFKFILEHSRIPALSIFLYFTLAPLYLASFNGVRQFLAVAIFAYSIRFILNHSFYKYLFIILVGSLFHITVILMLPLYFIIRRKIKIYHICILVATYIIMLQFVGIVIQMMGIPPRLLIGTSAHEGLAVQAYLLLSITICSFILRDKLIKKNEQNNVFTNLLLFGTIIAFTPLFTDLSIQSVTRMTSYFTFSLIVLIPEFILLFKNYMTKMTFLFTTILISTSYYFLIILIKGESYQLVPYYFNFNLF
jgi:hypothetical protein